MARDDAKIRQAMAMLRDAERVLRSAHMPASAGGVTQVRTWLRWCLATPKINRDTKSKPGYTTPKVMFSEKHSRGRKRNG